MATTQELIQRAKSNANTPNVYKKGYDSTVYVPPVSRFESAIESSITNKVKSQFGYNQDLDSSAGLYRLANQTGLKKKADRIISDNSGEDINRIFSGGFISDVFDVLNIASFGTVGLLKGKTFEEGIKNRESFSDQDSFGQYGLSGMIAGIALDIVTDPFTYIAPWTIMRKIPGLSKAAKAGKEKVFGKRVVREIEGTDKTVQELEGGIKPARLLAEKFHWMFGADPVYKETYERSMRSKGVEIQNAVTLMKNVAKIEPKTAEKLLIRDETGRFERKPIDLLQQELGAEEFAAVQPVWAKIDSLSEELKDLGVLGEAKFEETVGSYLKNAYTEYELARDKGIFGFKALGIKGVKARKKVEDIAEFDLTQIDTPAYLLSKTMLDMIKDVEDAKLFKAVNKNFATDVPQEGFTKLPESPRFQTTQGARSELASGIKTINKQVSKLDKELKITFKDDKALAKEMKDVTDDISKLSKLRDDELTKFLNEGVTVGKKTITPRKLGVIPDALQPLAHTMKKFDSFDEMMESSSGLQLEKLWLDGVLERNGFRGAEKAMEDFFNTVKHPFKPAVTKEGEQVLKGNIPKIVQLQKRVEALTRKSTKLSDIEKRSINNSFIHLEKQLSDLSFAKEDLIGAIQRNKLGELSGKYVPDNMIAQLDELINPSEAFGRRVMGEFKFMKVVMNPGTHIRNIMSNRILNYWKLGIGPHRVDRTIKAYKEIKNKGKFFKEAQKQGLGADTFAANELKGLLEDPSMTYLQKNLGGRWAKIKDTLGDVYQGEENLAKMEAFIHQRGKGLNPKDAWLAAESATFNYAQVTPFVRKMRTALWGVPFITFPLKATPIAIETALKKTQRVSAIGKIKGAIEQQSDIKETARERASEPEWVKDGFYFKLPWKDSDGRSAYFDLTYVIPFGDILSGQLFERPTRRETGLKETALVALPSKNPVFQYLKEITRNETFTGQRIFKESDSWDRVSADISMHMSKTFLPPFIGAQIPVGYNKEGEKALPGVAGAIARRDDPGQKRNVAEELLSYMGMKVLPMNAEINEQIKEFNKKKGLQTLLQDNGIVKDFSKVYQPK